MKTKVFTLFCFTLIAVVNPLSWIHFFDKDGYLGLSNVILIIIFDILVIAFLIILISQGGILQSLKIFSVNLMLIILGLVVCEVFFGNWFKSNSISNLWIPNNTSLMIDLKNLYPSDTQNIQVNIDKYGFRGVYKNLSNIDILTVGGSTTKQMYISDGLTWQDVLQKRFHEDKKYISIVNAGIDGQSTFGHINNFLEWFPILPNFRPKLTLLYIGINDFYRRSGNEFDSFDTEKRIGNRANAITHIIERKSIFAKIYRTYRGNYFTNAYGLDHDLDYSLDTSTWTNRPLLNSKIYGEIMEEDLKQYKKRLEMLSSLIEKIGSKPIFITQTTRRYFIDGKDIIGENCADILDPSISTGLDYNYKGFKYNGVDFYQMLKLLNDKTIEFAEENGYDVFDLSTDLQNELDIYSDYYDAYHNTPSGAEKIGDYIYIRLKDFF